VAKPTVRKLETYDPITREEFRKRFMERFYDPAFAAVSDELEKIFEIAWDGYIQYRKSPRKQPAGPGFAHADFPLAVEWLETRARILEAQQRFADSRAPTRVLLVNASTRSEHSCPAEISKTKRLVNAARDTVTALDDCEVDLLDLSTLADEPWKVIHPCKACVSTAMPLCHWPCSCYPNHAMGQTNDWMAEIYPRWVAAHGVMIVCPVHWYQAPASLKLMMDRLVCADGGNPDPTTTNGKDPEAAKELELTGWGYTAPSCRSCVFGHRARRRGRSRKPAAQPRRLAARHRPHPGGKERGDPDAHWLLSPLRDQPRRSRRGRQPVRRDAQRRHESRQHGSHAAQR
jgi:multimeric flavodoxin WrbA